MVQIIKKISLEVSKPNLIQAIVAKQYDNNSRFLQVTLMHEGKKIEIAPTSTVTINAKRNDGEEKPFAGEANNDGTATVPLTYWMLELEGEVWCDVSVVDTDGRKLSSTKFDLQVEKASCSSGDVTEDENYDVLVKLIEDVNKAKPELKYDPTSENAQSGVAVEEGIKELYDANIDVGQIIEGEYVDYNGNIAKSAGNHRTDYVPVKAGYTVKFENLKLQGLRSVCVYDENKKFIKVIANGTTERTATVVIPDGACYFIASVYPDETQYAKYIDPIAKDIADVKNAIKDVNGIKYITETVNAHELDYGIYIVDENNGGIVSFSDTRFNNILFTSDITSGIIIVTPFWATDKMFTVSTYECGAYLPVFFQAVYSGGEWLFDDYTYAYANTKYVDEQIASLQAQICEEKLFTFSFDELGEDILSKSIEKGSRDGVPYTKITFDLVTATQNADGTFTPYFDLPIEYMANPTLMADAAIKNLENFKSFAVKSPLLSKDFQSYELLRHKNVYGGNAKDFDIRIVALKEEDKVGIRVVWYFLHQTESSRDYVYSNVVEPVVNSFTDFALKYENHKIPTVKPKKLV